MDKADVCDDQDRICRREVIVRATGHHHADKDVQAAKNHGQEKQTSDEVHFGHGAEGHVCDRTEPIEQLRARGPIIVC